MPQTSFYVKHDRQLYQRACIPASWEGSVVIERTGTTAELYREIPTFTRHPYRSEGEENRYKDEIRRQPLELTHTELPIATVSKTYFLAQHRDVISSTATEHSGSRRTARFTFARETTRILQPNTP